MDEIKIVRIKWNDTTHYQGWHKPDELDNMSPLIIESVGWLIRENETAIFLAMSHGEYRIGDILIIPKKMVLERWEL